MKKYSIQKNIGHSKYVVSFSDGIKTHKDGSLFYDIRIFSNKKKLDSFVKELQESGYILK